jgi:16S rRNA (cytosine967-C5)-methyltransferase
MVAGRAQQARSLGLEARRKVRTRSASSNGADASLPGLAVRRTATAILRQVIEHRVPLDSLVDEQHGNPHYLKLDTRDRALARAILGAALRHRGEIQTAVEAAIDKKLPQNSEPLLALLHIAAAQILFLDIPDHAAVNVAVEQAASDRRTGRARGLVNAVLRTLVRDRSAILARPDSARSNTPDWLFERWVSAYGEADTRRIAEAHSEPPGLDLSVKRDAELWAERLGGTLLPSGSIRLAETSRVTELPGFAEGAWWVQDAAAALPVRLLGNVHGKRVADLCAAPGGKTAELAAAGAAVTAVDISQSRLKRLDGNLKRLGLQAELVAADLNTWQPEEAFDAVLLDAPCSSTGTIRRHPDIPWLKQQSDIAVLAKLQAEMLARAAAWVRPGGLLVYCTCSLEPEEGDGQVAPFLDKHPDFALVPIEAHEIGGLEAAITSSATLRTLPFHSFGEAPILRGMDGFFAARFRRG